MYILWEREGVSHTSLSLAVRFCSALLLDEIRLCDISIELRLDMDMKKMRYGIITCDVFRVVRMEPLLSEIS